MSLTEAPAAPLLRPEDAPPLRRAWRMICRSAEGRLAEAVFEAATGEEARERLRREQPEWEPVSMITWRQLRPIAERFDAGGSADEKPDAPSETATASRARRFRRFGARSRRTA